MSNEEDSEFEAESEEVLTVRLKACKMKRDINLEEDREEERGKKGKIMRCVEGKRKRNGIKKVILNSRCLNTS
ncbi:8865_t:CDS:2 [Entrophospora sp. SA101]|nr:3408_t:CDS:2 [Entrophospora sp. SA101]CAJ0846776.1 8865_t:CDS:2 [Entrophospora sp. SA101]